MIAPKKSSFRNRSERGSSTIELILLTPLVFLMIFLVLFVGWYHYAKLSAQNAAYSTAVMYSSWSGSSEMHSYGIGNPKTPLQDFILQSGQGMKVFWEDNNNYVFPHSVYANSRLGGLGFVMEISPQTDDEFFYSLHDFFREGSIEANLPHGGAYFFFAPLTSPRTGE
jgi:hypothetical protein